ncbi:hypothetical protein BKA64DRAFT_256611 [Cadophora sp. MPI-SDFR-AT-0126]|nr:hypothetical protein BKA64DRAFT_256611 [Leotiomycetes sp. MPI-SDFR-AT-0126]
MRGIVGGTEQMTIPRTTRQPSHRRCKHLTIIKSAAGTINTFLPMLCPGVDFRYNTKLLRSPALISMNNMSAPPLNEAEPISVGASFYNATDATCLFHETTPETAEDMVPPLNSTPGLGEFSLLDSNFEIAADLDPLEPSYIGEDGRFTLLRGKICESGTLNPANPREIYTIFRDMATNSSGAGATMSQETLRLLPIMLRAVIQYVGELQTKNTQLHMRNARLQATQGSGQAKEHQIEAHIDVLQGEIESVKVKLDELRRDMREVEGQKDILKADLERLGVGAVLDSGVESSGKRRRQG